MTKNKKGFTLVELVVVMAIIAVLVALALFAINAARLQGRNTERRSNIQAFKVALESYFSAHREYPGCGGAVSIYGFDGSCGGQLDPSVGQFIAVGFEDPVGGPHNERSCYTQTGGQTYQLRMLPEVLTGGTPPACGNIGTYPEIYDQN